MILVIQCAATKRKDAGHLETRDGKLVDFIADPKAAPADTQHAYARPDDVSDEGKTWRELLLEYNDAPGNNPLGLLPAYQLYENRVYSRLVEALGATKVYVLSAGWGLIRSAFLTPYYDITFSINADAHKRRRQADRYEDFCMLPLDTSEDVVFLGGKDYLPLFCALTAMHRARRTAFYNSVNAPKVTGCLLRRYETTTRTNWPYECASALLDGRIDTAF
jgi:hypothetical protein